MTKETVFNNVLPDIISNLMASPKLSKLPEVALWVKTIVEGNMKGGKHTRGIMTLHAYETFEKLENITEENRKLSMVLGWCLEMIQGVYCIVDDIMDGSTTRRGTTCWYLMPNVGMGAINDSILLSCCVTETLEKYFLNTPHFADLVRLFHEATLLTTMGQHVDYSMAHNPKHDYSHFTIERYETDVVPYKYCFFTFKMPILLGLTLVKDVDMKIHTGIDDICVNLAILYQMQDDYNDCYGDETLTGKVGTDIQERKCTWLAATAIQLCNEEQMKLFTKYYGSKKPDHVAIIKKLYDELELPKLYKLKEIEMHNEIVRLVKALPSAAASKYFFTLLQSEFIKGILHM